MNLQERAKPDDTDRGGDRPPATRGLTLERTMNFRIPTNQGAHDHAKDLHGPSSWRYKVVKFTHSGKVQVVLMGLLFLDVIILFVELLFLAQFPHCNLIERDAISCCSTASAEHDDGERFLSEDDHHSGVCELPEEATSYTAGCDEHKWAAVHTTEEVLFALTITILALFFVELNASMIALGPRVFFRQFFFLLDYVIITVSLVLELVFHFLNDAIYQSLAGFLVAIRIWRFVRIGHGIVEITSEMAHHQYEGLLAYTAALEDIMTDNNLQLPECEIRKEMGEDDDNILKRVEHDHLTKIKKKYDSGRNSGISSSGELNSEGRTPGIISSDDLKPDGED